jgi:hypothetical protein
MSHHFPVGFGKKPSHALLEINNDGIAAHVMMRQRDFF